MTTYPYGYAVPAGGGPQGMGTQLSLAQLLTKSTVAKMHPEFRRRVFALMEYAASHGVPLGIGTAWRSYEQQAAAYAANPGSFAAPGNSNHEGFPANGNGDRDAVAADMVPNVSWPWMEANLAAFGLRSFRKPSTWGYKGTREDWHIQPIEIPASRQRRTVRWDLPGFPLPLIPVVTDPPPVEPPPVVPPAWPPFDPANRVYGLYPLSLSKDVLEIGSEGDTVRYLQGVLRWEVSRFARLFLATGEFYPNSPLPLYLTACRDKCEAMAIDGGYGPKTALAVEYTQRAFGGQYYAGRTVGPMTPDGKVGRSQTWPFIDSLADGTW